MIKKTLLLVSAITFALYMEYQIFLAVQYSTATNSITLIVRITGIIVFMLISAATFFMLIPHPLFVILHRFMMISGLAINFAVKLVFNGIGLFEKLDFSYPPSIIKTIVYLLSELAIFLLLTYFIFLPRSLENRSFKAITKLQMTNVIALYSLCLLMECFIVVKYGAGIDISTSFTLLGKLLYYLGFIGLASYFLISSKDWTLPEGEATPEAEDLVFSEVTYDYED